MSLCDYGPLMIDVEGLTLSKSERKLLSYRCIGGLILFKRNFESTEQLSALVSEIRAVKPNILISVDHEGGRVQRFREGFTRIPPMAVLGSRYESAPDEALQLANDIGWLFASELLAFDIDFSFAPVLDRDYGISEVIGDRAFSGNPDSIIKLSSALIAGMNDAGMASTGKHYPGHGAVAADSHLDLPIDNRTRKEIVEQDLDIFVKVFANSLQAVMPAHVVYPQVDSQPAGFSRVWLQEILRVEIGFDGVIFSDDLAMAGAEFAGSFVARADAALDAGCDMVLVCNNRIGALEVANYLEKKEHLAPSTRLQSMKGAASSLSFDALQSNQRWLDTRARLSALN